MSAAKVSHEQAAVADRLRSAREKAGFESAADAARELQFSFNTYRSHENGNRGIKQSVARKYAKALGIPFEWLWTGAGEMGSVSKHTLRPNVALDPRPVQSGWRQMPLYGRVYGSKNGGVIIDADYSEKTERPKSLEDVDEAYGLEVIGDSMADRYLPGEIVHVNPLRAYHKGSYVVIQIEKPNGDTCGYIKRFVRQNKDEVVVEQLNPAMEITFPANEVKAIHLVVGTAIR